jgi:hypothetical protein
VDSFGIVLLELLSGRKVVQDNQNISTWAGEKYKQGLAAVLDPQLELPLELDAFQTVMELALECVHREHQFRPKMKDVSSILSGAAATWHTFEHGDDAPDGEWRPRRRESKEPAEIEEDLQYQSTVQQLL